jgi:hypothetical protein
LDIDSVEMLLFSLPRGPCVLLLTLLLLHPDLANLVNASQLSAFLLCFSGISSSLSLHMIIIPIPIRSFGSFILRMLESST